MTCSSGNHVYISPGLLPTDQRPFPSSRQHSFYSDLLSAVDPSQVNSSCLAEEILQGELLGGCDGSFDPTQRMGSFSSILATKRAILVQTSGPCNSAPVNQSAQRTELCSIVVTLHLISTICNHYQLYSGSVTIYNDCSKAIKLICSPERKFKRFLIDNYDLVHEAQSLLLSIRKHININLSWVKGHYSGKKREIQCDLNDLVHKLANG